MAELRFEVLEEARLSGIPVAEVCRRHGISRETYYQYRRRYLAEGLAGLQDKSRRPMHSPRQMPGDIEETICRMRKDHPRWGARRIRTELERAGFAPPALSSVHQALRRNHLVALAPPRTPKATLRFERDIANDLWQIDATLVPTASGKVWVLDMIDDHSRYLLAACAAPAPSGEAAWDCFEIAASRYGLPRQVLSDNGMCFTGRLQGVEVAFERSLRELGVELINAGPYHPQTLGKLERFHRTLKTWLFDEGPARDTAHLQELLDAFRHHYNKSRPHQGIGDVTPAERYGLEPVAAFIDDSEAAQLEFAYPAGSPVRTVSSGGVIGYRKSEIYVGNRFAGTRVRLIEIDGRMHIYAGEQLIRSLVFDPTRSYHPAEKPRPRRHQAKTVR